MKFERKLETGLEIASHPSRGAWIEIGATW